MADTVIWRHAGRTKDRHYELWVYRNRRELKPFTFEREGSLITPIDEAVPMNVRRSFAEWFAERTDKGRIQKTPDGYRVWCQGRWLPQ